jgi:hypothetical protein
VYRFNDCHVIIGETDVTLDLMESYENENLIGRDLMCQFSWKYQPHKLKTEVLELTYENDDI